MKSEKREEKVMCPLSHREILEIICTDTILVAEDLHPERFAPKEIRAVPNWKAICRNCPNNPYNEEDAQ